MEMERDEDAVEGFSCRPERVARDPSYTFAIDKAPLARPHESLRAALSDRGDNFGRETGKGRESEFQSLVFFAGKRDRAWIVCPSHPQEVLRD